MIYLFKNYVEYDTDLLLIELTVKDTRGSLLL